MDEPALKVDYQVFNQLTAISGVDGTFIEALSNMKDQTVEPAILVSSFSPMSHSARVCSIMSKTISPELQYLNWGEY